MSKKAWIVQVGVIIAVMSACMVLTVALALVPSMLYGWSVDGRSMVNSVAAAVVLLLVIVGSIWTIQRLRKWVR